MKAMKEAEEQQTAGYVYILCNDRKTVLYLGSTANLVKRIYAHKKKLISGFTRKYNVHRLIYFEQYPSMEQARTRERYLKGKTRAKKIALIEASNPSWKELSLETTN
jgi:putative endonuclease